MVISPPNCKIILDCALSKLPCVIITTMARAIPTHPLQRLTSRLILTAIRVPNAASQLGIQGQYGEESTVNENEASVQQFDERVIFPYAKKIY